MFHRGPELFFHSCSSHREQLKGGYRLENVLSCIEKQPPPIALKVMYIQTAQHVVTLLLPLEAVPAAVNAPQR